MTQELVQQSPSEVQALKEFYEKSGQLKQYNREFRIARNITDEKLAAMPRKFIPRWCKALDDAGVPTIDARRIVEADALSLGWTTHVIIKAIPPHYKNQVRAKAGAAGGRATFAAKSAAPGALRGLAGASQDVRDRVAKSGGDARAEDVEGLIKAGIKGGNAVSDTYGPSYFSEIGKKGHVPVEVLLTGVFEVNPLEWKERLCSTMDEAIAQSRNVTFVVAGSKLVTIRPAGISLAKAG